jgi:prefoldin subunit 5
MEKLGISLEINSSGMAKGISDLDKLGKAGDKAETSISGLATAFKAAAVAGASFAAIATANSMLKTAAATESLIGQLKVATGSMENAVKAFGELNKLNTLMPESVEGITSAFIKMKNLGLEPTAQALMSFSNTAAASGKQIMDFVEAVADATTGEFERLKEFGIKTSKEGEKVAFTFQGVTTSIKNDATAINQYLENIGNTTFAGSAAAQMETLSGAVSNVSASYDNMLLSINAATGSSETAKGVLVSVTTVMDSLTSAISAAYGEAEKMQGGFDGLIVIGKSVASTIQAISATFEGLSTAVGFVGAAIASFGDSTISISGLWDEYNKQIGEITAKTIKFNEVLYSEQKPVSLQEVAKTLDPIAKRTQAAATATDAYALSSKELEKEQKRAAKAIEDAKNAIEKQMAAINAAQVAMRKFTNGSDFERMNSDIEELNQSWKVLYDEGLISAQEYADALYQMDVDRLGFSTETNRKIADSTKETVDLTVEAMKNSLKRLEDAFVNVWEDIFNGASDFGSSLKRWFISLLAELAHAAITKPIVISMSGALGIGGSSSAMASGGFNVGNLSSLGNAFSGLTTAMGSAATYIGSMAAGAGSAQAAMLAAQSGAFGMQGAALTTQALGSSALGSAMSTMAAAAPYIAAALVIDQLTGGKISTGIMGGARGERTRALNIGIQDGQVSGESNIYRSTNYDAGWGRSGSWNVDNIGGAEFNATIKATVDAMAQGIKTNAEKLGLSFNEGFSGQFDADLFGKSAEEAEQIIADTFKRIGNAMTDSVAGLSEMMAPLQQNGEQTYETLARVTSQFELFNSPVGRLNDSLTTLNMTTLTAVDSLASMAGGMQNLAAMQSNFINAFYTDAQKAELTAETVGNIFDSIGMKAPESRAALIALVESLDLTTEAGRKAYVAITGATATLDAFYQDTQQTYDKALDNLRKAVDREKDLLTKAYNDRLEALNGEKESIAKTVTAISALKSALKSTYDTIFKTIVNPMVSYTRSQASLFAMARAGVLPNQSDLEDALQGVSNNDQKYYASFEDYARDQSLTGIAINEIMLLTDAELTVADKQLLTLEEQLAQLKQQYDQDIAALEATLAKFDSTIEAVMSVEEAIKELTSLLTPKQKTSVAVGGGGGGSVLGRTPNEWATDWHGNTATFTSQYGARWMAGVDENGNPLQQTSSTSDYTSVLYTPDFGKVYSGHEIVGGAEWLLSQGQEKDLYTIANNLGMSGPMLDTVMGWESGTSNAWAESQGLPSFAVGTNYIPQDMIAQVHKGEMIVPAKYNPMTSGIGGDAAMLAELQALRAEIAELKAQDRQIGVQLIKSTSKTADYIEQWDTTGLKVEVMA